MINNVRQLSRSLVGIYHWREIKYERFGVRPSVGGRPGALIRPCRTGRHQTHGHNSVPNLN